MPNSTKAARQKSPLDCAVRRPRWTYMQQYRCGCLLEFTRRADVRRHCPQHLRDKQGDVIKAPNVDSIANSAE